MLGVIGCTALGFSVIGIVAFGVMVHTSQLQPRGLSWYDMQENEYNDPSNANKTNSTNWIFMKSECAAFSSGLK